MVTKEEADLLERARRFDHRALAEIYDVYSPKMYAYAARLVGDPSTAEECVAETFSRFLRAIKAGQGPQAYLQAYLYRVAHNWITDLYRRQPVPALSLSEMIPGDGSERPDRLAAEHFEQQEVRAALLRLTPDQRQVILLKYIEGLENQEIAAALQKPVGAVKSLQHRALEALRRMLVPSGQEEVKYEPDTRAA